MKQYRAMLLKCTIALVVAFGLLMLSLPGELIMEKLSGKKYYGADRNYPVDAVLSARLEYGVFGDAATQMAPLMIAVGTGLFVSLLVWNNMERRKITNLIFIPVLITLVSLSLMNYGMGDELFDRTIQTRADLVICLLAVVMLLKTWAVRTGTKEDLVLKAIIIFVVFSQAVLLPGIYAILWHYNIRGYILTANAKILPGYHDIIPDFTNSHLTWITCATMAGGIVIALFFILANQNNAKPGISMHGRDLSRPS